MTLLFRVVLLTGSLAVGLLGAVEGAPDPVEDGATSMPLLSAEPVTRHAGDGRIATAVAVSRSTFSSGTRHAVLATAARYPDALAGSALAGALGGPVLLTGGDTLEASVEGELRRLDPDTVTVLGGPDAVSDAVVDAIGGDDLARVRRIQGTTRFETAARAARQVAADDVGHAYVVQGQHPDADRGWPDAVAVSALAAGQQAPVLLTTRDELPGVTAEAVDDLDLERVTIVGGTGAVSPTVGQSLEALGVELDRLAGPTRYATSAAVADRSAGRGLDAARPWLVTGRAWPDALAAGPAAAHAGEALLLADGADLDLSAPAQRWLAADPPLSHATLVGGESALSAVNERDLVALVGLADAPSHQVAAAGDIACDPGAAWEAADVCRHGDTAELAAEADSVLALGDLQYRAATRANFESSYEPTWGQFKERTYPTPGNHEYYVGGARDYHAYFDERVGEPGRAYYETELGGWQVLSLDSNCGVHDGCEKGSGQERWLRERLQASDAACRLAFMHHPPHSSGGHASHPEVEPLMRALYDHDVDVLVTAHNHSYERLRRATPGGQPDPGQGVRGFVVGTGGVNLRPLSEAAHRLTVTRTDQHFGVLRLELGGGGYTWEFEPLAHSGRGEGEFADAGFGSCR